MLRYYNRYLLYVTLLGLPGLYACFDRPTEKEIQMYAADCNASNIYSEGLYFYLTGFKSGGLDSLAQLIVTNKAGLVLKDTFLKLEDLKSDLVKTDYRAGLSYGDTVFLNNALSIKINGMKITVADIHLQAVQGNNAMGGAMITGCLPDSATINGTRGAFSRYMTFDKKDFK
ncbi:hypothetical protein [Niabella hirudinis]|uniref:hypothetical protein n=1 Tax=Niabella hirudinis TaxID=1285929 RepID=UPI003EBD69EF